MPIVEGFYNTAGVYSGGYYNWLCEYIPIEISLVTSSVIGALEDPKSNLLEAPTARLEVKNLDTSVVTAVSDMESFTVARNTLAEQDLFSAVIADAATWTPRGTAHPNLLKAGHTRRRITLYVDITWRGATLTFTLFTGMITKVDAQYGRPETSLHLEGVNLAELLKLADGTVENFVGSRVNLITRLLVAAGITDIYLAVDDSFISPAQSFLGQTAQATLNAIFAALGGIDYSVDVLGAFVARAGGSAVGTNWTYDTRKNCLIPSDSETSGGLVTTVNVVGATAAASLTHDDTQGRITTYGRRVGTIQSNLLQTAAEANSAAQALIDASFRAIGKVRLKGATLNPVMLAGDSVSIGDVVEELGGKGSGLNGMVLTIRSVASSWQRDDPAGTFTFEGDAG